MLYVTRFGDHVRLELHPMDSRVTTVVLDRPERRNAVDRQVADALRAAFELFDAGPSMTVAMLRCLPKDSRVRAASPLALAGMVARNRNRQNPPKTAYL
ncbi:hypothetical protein [Caballeronia sp. 15715]|uniref:hypothetical protein n=1 Tax=unclassified Caballeronia TaxID=2646786 RepID=UPI0039E6CAD4